MFNAALASPFLLCLTEVITSCTLRIAVFFLRFLQMQHEFFQLLVILKLFYIQRGQKVHLLVYLELVEVLVSVF